MAAGAMAAGAAVGAGLGLLGAATGAGKTKYRAGGMPTMEGYDPNAYQYGGRAGAAEEQAGYYGGLAGAADERMAPGTDYRSALASRMGRVQMRGRQQQGLNLLQSAAEGSAPSAAELAAKRQGDAQLQAQVGAALSARGGPAAQAAAMRNAGARMGQGGVELGAALQQGRAAEMAQARGEYMGAMGQVAGQDLAQMQQDAAMAQYLSSLGLQSRSLNDRRAMELYALREGVMGRQMAGQMGHQQALLQGHTSANAINAGINQQNAGMDWQYLQMVGSGAQGGGMMGSKYGGGGGGGEWGKMGGIRPGETPGTTPYSG